MKGFVVKADDRGAVEDFSFANAVLRAFSTVEKWKLRWVKLVTLIVRVETPRRNIVKKRATVTEEGKNESIL